MGNKIVKYRPSRTGAKFHKSNKFIRGFKGPVGSGKSVACIKEMMRLMKQQKPNNQGVRLSRWAVIRNTRPELINTTCKTFDQWFPAEISKPTSNPQLKRDIKFKLEDGTVVKSEVLFLALDQEKDTKKLLSLELSGVFINEAREVLYSIVTAARSRLGRYPSMADGYNKEQCHKDECPETGRVTYSACTRKALIMDTNPPDDSHWWYHLDVNGCIEGTAPEDKERCKGETRELFDFFNSPAPLIKQKDGSYKPNPEADNIEYLSGGYRYYLDMIAGNTQDFINVMVLGNYGMLRKGKPVYPEYNDILHCDRELRPISGLPIAMGWDFGLTPTCVIGQMTQGGQVRILDELVGSNMSVRAFARDVVLPFLVQKYAGYEIQFSLGDPAGNNRGEGEGKSAIGILNDDYEDGERLRMPIITECAPTNDPTMRLDAVKSFLLRLVDGGRPGFVVSDECGWLRKGFMGGYSYRRMAVSGERYTDKPDKNEYSHPHDALQYLVLGFVHGYDSAVAVDDSYEPPSLTGGY